jgi:hypothetical protein
MTSLRPAAAHRKAVLATNEAAHPPRMSLSMQIERELVANTALNL